jgi:hypothetical protein
MPPIQPTCIQANTIKNCEKSIRMKLKAQNTHEKQSQNKIKIHKPETKDCKGTELKKSSIINCAHVSFSQSNCITQQNNKTKKKITPKLNHFLVML